MASVGEVAEVDKDLAQHVRGLRSPERRTVLPDRWAIRLPMDEKDHSGAFFGRETELRALHEHFWQIARYESGDKSPRHGTSCTVLLTNGPGVGKSSLVEEFQNLADATGICTLQLVPEEFLSEDQFVRAVTSSSLWRGTVPMRMEHWWESHTDAGMAAKVETVARNGVSWSEDWHGPFLKRDRWQEQADTVHRVLSPRHPETAKEVLQALSEACRGGFIIAVDECQSWADFDSNETLRRILQMFADLDTRRDYGVSGGGLLLAGLGDTEPIVAELMQTRTSVLHLPTLRREDCREMVVHELGVSGAPSEIVESWADVLTADFHDWTLHARRAAVIGRDMLFMAQQPGSPEYADSVDLAAMAERLEWVRTATAIQVVQHYHDVVSDAKSIAGGQNVRTIAALAEATDNRFTHDAVHLILETDLVPEVRRDRRQTTELRVQLMHCGLLSYHNPERGIRTGVVETPEEVDLMMPIPSIVGHIRSTAPNWEVNQADAAYVVRATARDPSKFGNSVVAALADDTLKPTAEEESDDGDSDSNGKD